MAHASRLKFRIAFWLAVLQCVAVLGIAGIILFASVGQEPAEAVDLARTRLPIAYVMFSADHASAYVYVCAALSVLACFHLACKVIGKRRPALVAGLTYIAIKGPLAVAVIIALMTAASLQGSENMADVQVAFKSGQKTLVAVESIPVPQLLLAEAILDLPLLLILITGSWGREKDADETHSAASEKASPEQQATADRPMGK